MLQVLGRNRTEIENHAGGRIEVARILVRDAAKLRRVEVPSDLLTTNVEEILSDPRIGIVVELMGGVDRALSSIQAALLAGKAVVTANKDVMAECDQQVWAAARKGGAPLFFEASVAGGVPVVRALAEGLAGNRIHRMAGILNGTTNFILSRMSAEGESQAEALIAAQLQGYAEADPSADLDGLDAARKISILSSIAYAAPCHPGMVYREGIRGITPTDIEQAAHMGWTIKLLAISERDQNRVTMRVHPAFVPAHHPLAAVADAFNAVYIQGDPIGKMMLYGPGAGGEATASAVVADIVRAARWIRGGGIAPEAPVRTEVEFGSMDAVHSRFYLRLRIPDRVGVLGQIAGAFGRHGVSILSVLQTPAAGDNAELVIVTHQVREDRMQRAVAEVETLDVVERVASVIRLAPEDL